MEEYVDQTIEFICDWIQKKLQSADDNNNHEISDMTKALAELVSARVNFHMSTQMYKSSNVIQNRQKQ